jgi:hypothetical protein
MAVNGSPGLVDVKYFTNGDQYFTHGDQCLPSRFLGIISKIDQIGSRQLTIGYHRWNQWGTQ